MDSGGRTNRWRFKKTYLGSMYYIQCFQWIEYISLKDNEILDSVGVDTTCPSYETGDSIKHHILIKLLDI